MAASLTKGPHRITTQRALLLTVIGMGASTVCAEQTVPPAYRWVAQQSGVPAAVLYAVALQESGLTVQRDRLVPWPWTLNVAGTPRRFVTRTAACTALQRAESQIPATQIDVGLGQLNLGYQRQRFARACDLLNPYRNLAIAAQILREHYRVDNDWLVAIGHYHRPAGGAKAARYRHGVQRHLARVHGGDAASLSQRQATP